MRAERPGGLPVVIELVGLPGAGKTSLTKKISVPFVGCRDFRYFGCLLPASSWSVASATFKLAMTIRPFRFSYFFRALKFVVALRMYKANKSSLVVLDQGMIQKLWSMIIETESYSAEKLEQVVASIAPFAPDHLVWISVQPALAADRIAHRRGGNSRFDGQPTEQIVMRLRSLEAVYHSLVDLLGKHARVEILTLDGEAPLDTNAKKIDALAATYLAGEN